MPNSMHVIFPCKFEGAWVFDDTAVEPVQEPFVFGADDMIEWLVESMPDVADGFELLFLISPFPGSRPRQTGRVWKWIGCSGRLTANSLRCRAGRPPSIAAELRC